MLSAGGGAEDWVLSRRAGVTVRTAHTSVRPRRVIIAVAPPVARTIAHHPGLPDSRERVERDTFMGTIYEAVILYDEPFWRRAGLSGALIVLGNPIAAS